MSENDNFASYPHLTLTPLQGLQLPLSALSRPCNNDDVQTHLRTLTQPSVILLGYSIGSDLYALQLVHHAAFILLVFHHRHFKRGPVWLTRK